ncbi:Oxygen regulatory protein NreC [bacterium HR29]|nr:Oxygen regulatory protein NreC [bacterium HR29]
MTDQSRLGLRGRRAALQRPGPPPIRVLLVDDHAVIRQALRRLLESFEGVEVVADVENGREAVLAAQRTNPDVVLMDVVMPALNGVEATRQLRKAVPTARVIMLSGFVDEEQLVDAIRAGASGYLVKRSDVDEVLLAIRTVARGNTYFSAALAEQFDVPALLYRAKGGDESVSGLDLLTPREREVLQLIAEGYTNQRIAEELSVSIKTVEAHKAHISQKLKTKSRTDLIRYAIQKGILRLEDPSRADLPPKQDTA